MSYQWGDKSLQVRETLDPRLKTIVDDILLYMDVSILYGYRDEPEQNSLFKLGRSKLQYPHSKHNAYPSQAVDLAPYPYPDNENDLRAALGYMAGLAMVLGDKYDVPLRWGGDWNRNGSVVDNGFDDLFHIEIDE